MHSCILRSNEAIYLLQLSLYWFHQDAEHYINYSDTFMWFQSE